MSKRSSGPETYVITYENFRQIILRWNILTSSLTIRLKDREITRIIQQCRWTCGYGSVSHSFWKIIEKSKNVVCSITMPIPNPTSRRGDFPPRKAFDSRPSWCNAYRCLWNKGPLGNVSIAIQNKFLLLLQPYLCIVVTTRTQRASPKHAFWNTINSG